MIQQKYCTNTSESARFGARMSQISNFCVSIKLKESLSSVGSKLGRSIYAKGVALIAFSILHIDFQVITEIDSTEAIEHP